MTYKTGDINHEHLRDLWVETLRADTLYRCGYYAGRFEEYASQNAVSPDDFPAIRAAAAAWLATTARPRATSL